MFFRFTNVHMAAPVTPAAVDPWAYPSAPAPKKSNAVSPPMIARPPRSSSLKSQHSTTTTASRPQMTLIPLSVANSRADIKYRKEAFEVEERAMHLAFMRYALKA